MITPNFAFYGINPDYCTLFFLGGAIGSFRQVRDGSSDRTSFKSHSIMGIALGQSQYTNRMVFNNPTLDSFSISTAYLLDKGRVIGDVFSSVHYNVA